jgi:HPt (histidine-containing phosphotransfer) domain-containing protein
MPSQTPEVPNFDPEAIEKLKAVAGEEAPGFVAEMAQLFLDETREGLARLKSASAVGDWKQVNRIVHSLKSSAATLGLMRLSASCRALELDTKQAPSSPQTMTLVAAVLDDFEQARPALHRLL